MTTSIPEAPNSGRNWDYRYCWLRDAFFVVRALNSISEVATMEEYLRWLMNVVIRSGGGHIQPLYGIGQEEKLPEFILDHLPGYRGMGPVRVGNQAQEHFQHDVYGNILLGAAQTSTTIASSARAAGVRAHGGGRRAPSIYDTPDAGMWELRTRARVHTSSALMSWAACGRLAKIAAAGPARSHPLLARARRRDPRAHPQGRGARSARPSPKASAAATWTPAR